MPLFLPPAAAPAVTPSGGSLARDRLRHMSPFSNDAGATAQPWFTLNVIAGGSTNSNNTVNFLANRYYTVPFWTGAGGTLTGLSIYTNVAGTGTLKFAIWNNTSPTDLRPSTLLAQSPALNTYLAGRAFWAPNLVVPPDSLLWVTVVVSVSTPMTNAALATAWPILGHSTLLTNAAGDTTSGYPNKEGYGWWDGGGGNTFAAAFPGTYPSNGFYAIGSVSQLPAIQGRMAA